MISAIYLSTNEHTPRQLWFYDSYRKQVLSQRIYERVVGGETSTSTDLGVVERGKFSTLSMVDLSGL